MAYPVKAEYPMQSTVTTTDNCCYLISSSVISTHLSNESFIVTPAKQLHETRRGRAPVARVRLGSENGILRHYYRGGFMNRISEDKFLWTGIERTRAIREFRLLEWMTAKHLPVPKPLGARVVRDKLFYTCDLITREVPDTQTVASRLETQALDTNQWQSIGAAIRALHQHNVFHADLNANNILIDSNSSITLIDFDKCRQRSGSGWQSTNLTRLKRSLDKLTKHGNVQHFSAVGWQSLLNGYSSIQNI